MLFGNTEIGRQVQIGKCQRGTGLEPFILVSGDLEDTLAAITVDLDRCISHLYLRRRGVEHAFCRKGTQIGPGSLYLVGKRCQPVDRRCRKLCRSAQMQACQRIGVTRKAETERCGTDLDGCPGGTAGQHLQGIGRRKVKLEYLAPPHRIAEKARGRNRIRPIQSGIHIGQFFNQSALCIFQIDDAVNNPETPRLQGLEP